MAEERSQVDLGDVLLWLRQLDLKGGFGSEYEFVEAKERASQKIQDFRDGLDFPVIPEFVDEPFQALIEQFRGAAEDLITEFNRRSTLRDKFHKFLIAAAAGDIPVTPENNPDYRIVRLTRSWNTLTGNVMHNGKDFKPFLLEYLGSALLKVAEGCLVFKLDHPNSDETRNVLKRFMAEHGDSSFIKKFQDKLTSNVVQLIQKELEEHENISDIMKLAVELKKHTQVLVIGRVKDLSPAATSCSVMVALSHEFDLKNDLKEVETKTFVSMALQSTTLKLDKERVYDMFCAALRCKSSSLEHIRRLLNELEERDKDDAVAASITMKLGEASAPASKPGPSGTSGSTRTSPTSSQADGASSIGCDPQPEHNPDIATEPSKPTLETRHQKLTAQPEVVLDRVIREHDNFDDDDLSSSAEPIINQELIFTTDEDVKKLFTHPNVYEMSAGYRGRALILNNVEFEQKVNTDQDDLDYREGSDVDCTNIKTVLEKLGFIVTVQIDRDTRQMRKAIQKETEREDQANYGMFILVVLSHGDRDVVYGSDGRKISSDDIVDLLKPQKFVGMKGKPKWIIQQTCSGVKADNVQPDSNPADVPPPQRKNKTAQPYTSVSDLYILKSSFPGYMSLRDPKYGSYMIRDLVKVLYRYAAHKDLQSLTTEVRNRVMERSGTDDNKFGVQTVYDSGTLRKKIYLFPGYKSQLPILDEPMNIPIRLSETPSNTNTLTTLSNPAIPVLPIPTRLQYRRLCIEDRYSSSDGISISSAEEQRFKLQNEVSLGHTESINLMIPEDASTISTEAPQIQLLNPVESVEFGLGCGSHVSMQPLPATVHTAISAIPEADPSVDSDAEYEIEKVCSLSSTETDPAPTSASITSSSLTTEQPDPISSTNQG